MCVHCTYSSSPCPSNWTTFSSQMISHSHYFSLNLESTYERKHISLSRSVLIHFPNVILFFLDNFTVYIYHSLSFDEHCGGLNENGPHRPIYLNIWSPVGWKELGGLALLEVGWGGAFRFQKFMAFPVSFLCLTAYMDHVFMDQDVSSQLQYHACKPTAMVLGMTVMF